MNRLRTLLIGLVAGILVSSLTIYPNNSLALPFEVKALQTTYSTYVSTIVNYDSRVVTEGTQSSSTPISDYVVVQDPCDICGGTLAITAKPFKFRWILWLVLITWLLSRLHNQR